MLLFLGTDLTVHLTILVFFWQKTQVDNTYCFAMIAVKHIVENSS